MFAIVMILYLYAYKTLMHISVAICVYVCIMQGINPNLKFVYNSYLATTAFVIRLSSRQMPTHVENVLT
jgi:hypothetical protein